MCHRQIWPKTLIFGANRPSKVSEWVKNILGYAHSSPKCEASYYSILFFIKVWSFLLLINGHTYYRDSFLSRFRSLQISSLTMTITPQGFLEFCASEMWISLSGKPYFQKIFAGKKFINIAHEQMEAGLEEICRSKQEWQRYKWKCHWKISWRILFAPNFLEP